MDELTRKILADWISIFAGTMTIVGIPGLAIWSYKKKLDKLSALRVYRFMLFLFKLGLILLFIGIILIPSNFTYSLLIVLGKGSLDSSTFYWDDNYALAYLFSYVVTILIYGFVAFLGSACIYTGTIRPLRVIRENWNKVQITFEKSRYKPVEILEARYGTKSSFVDVKHILDEMLTPEKLEFTVGNSLFSDPIKGVRKTLELKIKVGDEVIEQKHKERTDVALFFDSDKVKSV